MLIVSIFAVFVKGFIVYTIRQNLSITKTTLNKIAILAFSIIVTFFLLLFKFVATLMLYLGQNLKQWIDAIFLFAMMISDSKYMLFFEFMLGMFLIIGFYITSFLSSEISNEV